MIGLTAILSLMTFKSIENIDEVLVQFVLVRVNLLESMLKLYIV